MGNGIKQGKATDESLGHLSYWLAKRCPQIGDELCKRFLQLEFPDRQKHGWLTIQHFAVYRGRANHTVERKRIGVKNDHEAAEVLKRIDGKVTGLKKVFQRISRAAAEQFEASLEASSKKKRGGPASVRPKRLKAVISTVVPLGYTGRQLPERIETFLRTLARHGFSFELLNVPGETINIWKNGKKYGYVDGTVIRNGGVVGYHFGVPPFQTDTNHAPRGFAKDHFCARYHCPASEIETYRDSRPNRKDYTYLAIKTAKVAERVLLKDAGIKRRRQTTRAHVRRSRRSQRFAEIAAVEGMLREVVRFNRVRNRTLRDAKLARSRGECEACKMDFSKVLGGKGTRVLLVHHDRQALADYRHDGQVTSEADLAVVCANCHMLLHMNPRRAMRVETLRKRLRKR